MDDDASVIPSLARDIEEQRTAQDARSLEQTASAKTSTVQKGSVTPTADAPGSPS